jgi:hypothetical protein
MDISEVEENLFAASEAKVRIWYSLVRKYLDLVFLYTKL